MPEEEKKPEEKTEEKKPAGVLVVEKTEEEKKREKRKERRGKKPHKNKPTSQRWKKYKIEGDKLIREKFCPRCGAGVFLMKAKDRLYCGKCHYTLFISKKQENTDKPKE